MTLKDIHKGPDWVLWAVAVLFAVISIVLLSGHGANLIAGYNTASEEEKSKYDAKKLCRTVGGGMSVITLLFLVMAIWESVLPSYFSTVFLVVTLIDIGIMLVLMNTVCRKQHADGL